MRAANLGFTLIPWEFLFQAVAHTAIALFLLWFPEDLEGCENKKVQFVFPSLNLSWATGVEKDYGSIGRLGDPFSPLDFCVGSWRSWARFWSLEVLLSNVIMCQQELVLSPVLYLFCCAGCLFFPCWFSHWPEILTSVIVSKCSQNFLVWPCFV